MGFPCVFLLFSFCLSRMNTTNRFTKKTNKKLNKTKKNWSDEGRSQTEMSWEDVTGKKIDMSIGNVSVINYYKWRTKIAGQRCGNQRDAFKF